MFPKLAQVTNAILDIEVSEEPLKAIINCLPLKHKLKAISKGGIKEKLIQEIVENIKMLQFLSEALPEENRLAHSRYNGNSHEP